MLNPVLEANDHAVTNATKNSGMDKYGRKGKCGDLYSFKMHKHYYLLLLLFNFLVSK